MGPCCEQTHAAFEVGLSLDQGQGVYSSWSDVVVSSQLRLCHTCIIDVMPLTSPKPATKPVWSRLSSLAFRPGSVLQPLLFYAHIINEPWYVAVFFMTCKCNIFNNWYVPNFVRIAGEYHITTMDGGSVPMHVMQLVGRIDHGANCSIVQSGWMIHYWSGRTRNRGELSSIQCCETN